MASRKDIHQLTPQLSDLELLFLICLIADNHCIVRAAQEDFNDVQRDIESISHSLFGFSCAVIDCHAGTTLEDISNAVLEDTGHETGSTRERASLVPFLSSRTRSRSSRSPGPTNTLDERRTCNVILARDLDCTERNVQVQALELMRSRRIYSRLAVHSTPKHFLFIALLSDDMSGPPFLTPHLNDRFFVSQEYNASEDDQAPGERTPSSTSVSSINSIIRRPSPYKRPSLTPVPNYRNPDPPISEADLAHLVQLVTQVHPSALMSRHIHDIPTHLRLHRHVAGGVSAIATRHITLLSRILAVLQMPAQSDQPEDEAHKRTPVITPTLVKLAATKVYAHRVEVVQKVEDERSMQWGSEWDAVAESLRGASVEKCIEETVLGLEVPA